MPGTSVGRFLLPITCRCVFAAVLLNAAACGGSPASPTANRAAALEVSQITATVESLVPDTVYRIQVGVRETSGLNGATLVRWRAAFGAGWSADGDFTGPGVTKTPRVLPNGTLRCELEVVLRSTVAQQESQVTTTLMYTDDAGHSGETTATTTIRAVSGT